MSTGVDCQRGDPVARCTGVQLRPVLPVIDRTINSSVECSRENVSSGIGGEGPHRQGTQAIVYRGPTVSVISRPKNSATPRSAKDVTAGVINCEGAHVGVCQSVVNARPRFCVVSRAKNATSLCPYKHVANRVSG